MLRRIDATRIYTNWGPLASELERRLSDHFGLVEGSVVSAELGHGRARRRHPCDRRPRDDRAAIRIVPAFTFAATAVAVEQCGYRPYVVDINPDTWMLDVIDSQPIPVSARRASSCRFRHLAGRFHRYPWVAFRAGTGIPVVIDGAASFERLSDEPQRCIGDVPISLSFHATKTFATGEGGAVVTTDPQRASAVTEALNFGFFANRESRSASTNGKMSEYHAAVGLAEFQGWPAKRLAFQAVADRYRQRLDSVGLRSRCVAAPTVSGCYVLFQCRDALEAARST